METSNSQTIVGVILITGYGSHVCFANLNCRVIVEQVMGVSVHAYKPAVEISQAIPLPVLLVALITRCDAALITIKMALKEN